MSVAADLAFLLRNAGLDNVFEGQLPAKPDELVMVRATGGVDPLFTHGVEQLERPRAQVIVRAKTYAIAADRIELARVTLTKTNVMINGTRYLRIRLLDSPTDLGADEQQPPRRLFSFNVQILKEG